MAVKDMDAPPDEIVIEPSAPSVARSDEQAMPPHLAHVGKSVCVLPESGRSLPSLHVTTRAASDMPFLWKSCGISKSGPPAATHPTSSFLPRPTAWYGMSSTCVKPRAAAAIKQKSAHVSIPQLLSPMPMARNLPREVASGRWAPTCVLCMQLQGTIVCWCWKRASMQCSATDLSAACSDKVNKN